MTRARDEEGIVLLLGPGADRGRGSRPPHAMSKTSPDRECRPRRQHAQHARAPSCSRARASRWRRRALQDDLVEDRPDHQGGRVASGTPGPCSRTRRSSCPARRCCGSAIRDARQQARPERPRSTPTASGSASSSKNFLKAVLAHIRETVPAFKGSSKLNDEDIDELADAILDWLDKDEETRVGTPEQEFYVEIEEGPVGPLNRPVFSLDELAPIPGLDPLLLDALKAYFTPLPDVSRCEWGRREPEHGAGSRAGPHLSRRGRRVQSSRPARRRLEILKARSEGKVFCAEAAHEPCTDFSATVGTLPARSSSRRSPSPAACSRSTRRRRSARRAPACTPWSTAAPAPRSKTPLLRAGLLMLERSIVGPTSELVAQARRAVGRPARRLVHPLRGAPLLPQSAPSEEVEATIQLLAAEPRARARGAGHRALHRAPHPAPPALPVRGCEAGHRRDRLRDRRGAARADDERRWSVTSRC